MKNQEKLSDPKQIQAFGSTYLDLRTKSKSSLMYNVIYMLRRLLISVLILVFKKWPAAQIQIMIFHSILVIIYNKLARPFEDPKLNKLEIFNELCIMVSAYHLFLFTPFVEDSAFQYKIGWSMIGVTVLNIVVNFAIMAQTSFRQL
jgi:hypothetical protein